MVMFSIVDEVDSLIFFHYTCFVCDINYVFPTIHTPNLLNFFSSIYPLFCQNNMIYRFLQHASCFMFVPCLDLCVYVLFAMFYAQIYILTCLYDVVSYALLGSICLCVYFNAIWLDPCLHMLICLDLCSSMFMY